MLPTFWKKLNYGESKKKNQRFPMVGEEEGRTRWITEGF